MLERTTNIDGGSVALGGEHANEGREERKIELHGRVIGKCDALSKRIAE